MRSRPMQCLKSISVLLLLSAVIISLYWSITSKTTTFAPVDTSQSKAEITYRQFADPLSNEDVSLMQSTLWEFTQTLEMANITYFMIEGTLLGSYRHHGRIPWDDDVDLIVNRGDKPKLKQLFRNTSAYVFMNAFGGKNHWKFFPKDGHLVSDYPFRSPFIDVFWFEENASHVFYTGPFWGEFLKSDIFPLRRRPFGEFMLAAPCNTTAYLQVAGFDIDQCVSRSMNHLDNIFLEDTKTVPCSELASIHPFVTLRRRQELTSYGKTFVIESLTLNGTVIKQWSYEDRECGYNATFPSPH